MIRICDRRRRILEADGHLLVTGGPGSGKTTIALLKAKTRIEAGIQPGQTVLFLSFSRAAVARIADASSSDWFKSTRGHLVVQTFHSLFWELLRTHGYLLGAPRRLRLLLPHEERVLRNGQKGDSADWVVEKERLFRKDGRLAFDLFASKALELLGASKSILGMITDRHPLVVVDEAQDTDEEQWACLKLLATETQVMCLADLEQQIYDYRPGVDPERLNEIVRVLKPEQVDLPQENHRSAGTEIVRFGDDILHRRTPSATYSGVTRIGLPPQAKIRDRKIRESVGILRTRIKEATGRAPRSMALLTAQGRGVAMISRALKGGADGTVIPHRALLDEASALVASRLVALLMDGLDAGEQLTPRRHATAVAAAESVLRALGGKSRLTEAGRLKEYSEHLLAGTKPKRSKVADALREIIGDIAPSSLTGEPATDWGYVEAALDRSGSAPLVEIAEHARLYSGCGLDRRLVDRLALAWREHGRYEGALAVFDAALAQEQLLADAAELRGLSVMTIHKAKGKEFDGVVILDSAQLSPLVHPTDAEPHLKSRKVFRVGITRARHHVLLLTDVATPTKLLVGHRLRTRP